MGQHIENVRVRDINIFATDAIEISGVENENNFISAISNRVFADATAEAGNINIETGSLSLGDRSAIATSSSGQGSAGNIQIDASDSVSLVGQGNASAILANNLGEGNAGSVSIDSVGNVDIVNNSNIEVAATIGNSGNILINSEFLTLNNGSFLFTSNLDTGDAGNVTINLTEDFNINNNSGIQVPGNIGDSGNIEINLKSLNVDNSPISLICS